MLNYEDLNIVEHIMRTTDAIDVNKGVVLTHFHWSFVRVNKLFQISLTFRNIILEFLNIWSLPNLQSNIIILLVVSSSITCKYETHRMEAGFV